MDLKIDDLLEKKNQGVDSLDMEYVSLNVNKVLALLNKYVAANGFAHLKALGPGLILYTLHVGLSNARSREPSPSHLQIKPPSLYPSP
jgi:hypothetical protein